MSNKETIRSSEDIGRIVRSGYRISGKSVTLIVAARMKSESNKAIGKVAFIAAKRLGTAVLRSRVKRVLRAAWSNLPASSNKETARMQYDMIIMANAGTAGTSSRTVGAELSDLIQRLLSAEGKLV